MLTSLGERLQLLCTIIIDMSDDYNWLLEVVSDDLLEGGHPDGYVLFNKVESDNLLEDDHHGGSTLCVFVCVCVCVCVCIHVYYECPYIYMCICMSYMKMCPDICWLHEVIRGKEGLQWQGHILLVWLVQVKLCNTTRIRVRVTCSADQLTQLLPSWESLDHLQCDLQWRWELVHQLHWIIHVVTV
jgi:hypothetical protein